MDPCSMPSHYTDKTDKVYFYCLTICYKTLNNLDIL